MTQRKMCENTCPNHTFIAPFMRETNPKATLFHWFANRITMNLCLRSGNFSQYGERVLLFRHVAGVARGGMMPLGIDLGGPVCRAGHLRSPAIVLLHLAFLGV